jgi:O-succinylbenzoic acid--CoA ligase
LPPAQREPLLALAATAAHPHLALIIATSGSTGLPKGVRLPWRALAAAARIGGKALDLRPGDAWLICLPLYFVGGAVILYRCLRAGATAVVHEGFDVNAVARDLAARRITHVSLVPAVLARLLDAAVPPGPTLKCVLVGGAALNATLLDRARAAGWPVRLSYGMTETCATALVDGRPLPGVRVRVGAAGTLEVASPARMRGYLGAADVDEWTATNDLATIDLDGRVTILGRADEMLISGGVNVHPLEIEARLAACPGVREAGVTGLADPVWGDIIAAAYEGEADATAVESWCRASLPSPRRPRRLLRVERLPRLPSGKLDRRALRGLW